MVSFAKAKRVRDRPDLFETSTKIEQVQLVFAWDIGKFVGIELTPGNNAKRLVKRKHRFVDRFIGVEGGMVEDTLAAKATYGEMFRTVMAVIIAAAMCRTDRVATMSMLI